MSLLDKMLRDIRHLIAGTELSEKEGELLINEIRIRIRKPHSLSEPEIRHEIVVAIADREQLPVGARWEQNGVSYSYITASGNGTIWGYISFFNILDAVIDRRIQKALERNPNDVMHR